MVLSVEQRWHKRDRAKVADIRIDSIDDRAVFQRRRVLAGAEGRVGAAAGVAGELAEALLEVRAADEVHRLDGAGLLVDALKHRGDLSLGEPGCGVGVHGRGGRAEGCADGKIRLRSRLNPLAEAAGFEGGSADLLLAFVVGAEGAFHVALQFDEGAGNAAGHFFLFANASDLIDVLRKVIDFDRATELLGAAGKEDAVFRRVIKRGDIGVGEDTVERRVIIAVGLP